MNQAERFRSELRKRSFAAIQAVTEVRDTTTDPGVFRDADDYLMNYS